MSVLSYFQRGVLTITETPGGQLARPEDNPSDSTHTLYSTLLRGQKIRQNNTVFNSESIFRVKMGQWAWFKRTILGGVQTKQKR